MKRLYLPESVIEIALPQVSSHAQAIFYKLLTHSGVRYQEVWSSQETIAKACKIKSVKTVRKYVRELESVELVRLHKKLGVGADGRKNILIKYEFLFQKWSQISKQNGKETNLEYIARTQNNGEIERLDKKIDTLKENVKDDLNALAGQLGLAYRYSFQNVVYFTDPQKRPASELESKFAEAGHKIKIIKGAASA